MKIGKALIDEINERIPAGGDVLAWWLGQHSFIIKIKDKIIYIDPYLSDKEKRLIPPFLKPEEITNADIILGTHDHSDHIDRPAWPAIAKASPSAKFAIPEAIKKMILDLTKIGGERIIGLNDLTTIETASVKITGIAAAHEFLQQDTKTGLYPFLGYVIEYDGVTLYHSGDCCVYDGLAAKLKRWKIDMAFLPINGRDAVRYSSGCIGNMTFQEAADLAGTVNFGLTIPAHYDMFAGNRENPKSFTDYMAAKYPSLKTMIPRYCTAFNLKKAVENLICIISE
jgi:L-ascorbate metabolism protein UlaG (beta-lactamase superfamily)